MRTLRSGPKRPSCARHAGPIEVGPPAGCENVYAASSGVSTISIIPASPRRKPHHDIDQDSMRWLWITLVSFSARWMA
jgi:hypothetical protein